MTNQQDRRDRVRLPGQVLFVKIGFAPYPLIDVSEGGIAFEAEGFSVGQSVDLKIVSVLDESDTIDAKCEVLNVEGYRVATRFTDPPQELIDHIKSYIDQWD